MIVLPATSEPVPQPLPTISMAALEQDSISVEESERLVTELIHDHFNPKQ